MMACWVTSPMRLVQPRRGDAIAGDRFGLYLDHVDGDREILRSDVPLPRECVRGQHHLVRSDAESAALELADLVARQSNDGVRALKEMFRDLERSAQRIEYENERLLHFQRCGIGLPHR